LGQLAVLLSLFTGLVLFTDMPEKMRETYEGSVAAARMIATAGDLRSMSNMLDYHYMKRGRYPRRDHFDRWLAATFKENSIKELSLDHWGNGYVYSVDEKQQSYLLVSRGPDGMADTADDLKVTGP